MRKSAVFLAMASFLFISSYGQKNASLCKVEVADVSKVTSFGYLVGYSVQFKNSTSKSLDGIYWTAYFYNNSDDLIKTEESTFNSTSMIDPISSGQTKTIVRSPNVKGASKVRIVIDKVHFVDKSTCAR